MDLLQVDVGGLSSLASCCSEQADVVSGAVASPGTGGGFASTSSAVAATREIASAASLVRRIRDEIDAGQPMSDLDWARPLLLTEICWGSDLLGAGVKFETNIRDERALPLLRSIQYKVSNYQRFRLLRDNAIGVLEDPDES